MKHLSLLLTPLLLLSACGSSVQHSESLEEQLKNPLFAQKYYTDLSEHMVTLELNNDPVLKLASKKSTAESIRKQSVQKVEDAMNITAESLRGTVISDQGLAEGRAALTDTSLFFGTDFFATPGPSLHVYLTTAVDPRTIRFPDDTALDLGLLKNPYGAQSFILPGQKTKTAYRTVVIWDKTLGKLHGFAQLQKD